MSVERLEETQDELVNIKISIETDKQRQAAVTNPQTIDESADQMREMFVEEQHQGDSPLLQAGVVDTVPLTVEDVPPLPEHRSLGRRDTLLSPPNIVLQLESKQREWERE